MFPRRCAAQRGFLGRSGNGAKWRGFYFFRGFWAVPGMAPPRQTWRVAVDEGGLRVLAAGVLAIMIAGVLAIMMVVKFYQLAAYSERVIEKEVRRITLLSTGHDAARQVPIGKWETMTWADRFCSIIRYAKEAGAEPTWWYNHGARC